MADYNPLVTQAMHHVMIEVGPRETSAMMDFFLEFISHWFWLSVALGLMLYSFKSDIPSEPESRTIIRVLSILCVFGVLAATVFGVYGELATVRDEVKRSLGQK